MKMFITGASGFIGQNLVRRLAENNTIYATGRRPNPFSDLNNIEYTCLDLSEARDSDLSSIIKDAEYAILLGASQMNEANISLQRAMDVNVGGTEATLKAMESSEIKDITLISTATITSYCDGKVNGLTSPQPKDAYSITKYEQEECVRKFCVAKALDYTIFRLQNAYGPGQLTGVVPSFIKKAVSGEAISVNGNPKDARDFIYISDVIDLLIKAMENPANKVLPLGTGKLTTIVELAQLVREKFNPCLEIKESDTSQLVFRRDFADVEEMKKVFGNLSFVSLEEGIEKTYDWLL